MAAGFPLNVSGTRIPTIEHLYQASRFPDEPELQRLVLDQKSPMTAKMKTKPHRDRTRSDWTDVRVLIMKWCLSVKLAQHLTKFGDLLLATGDKQVVEESPKDDFWGAKPMADGTLVGQNVLGLLLTELRQKLRSSDLSLQHVRGPLVPNFLLLGRPIDDIEMQNAPERKPETAIGPSARENPVSGTVAPVAPHLTHGKWRTFGHDKAVNVLQRSLTEGRLSHAYMLTGPPNVGKMTLALDLARAVNCLGDDRPCGECDQCGRIERGVHADVSVIGPGDGDSSSQRVLVGIDQVREAQRQASLKPFEGRSRVFVFSNAEQMERGGGQLAAQDVGGAARPDALDAARVKPQSLASDRGFSMPNRAAQAGVARCDRRGAAGAA